MWRERTAVVVAAVMFMFGLAPPAMATWTQFTSPKDCEAILKLVGQESKASLTVTSRVWQNEASDFHTFENGGDPVINKFISKFYWVITPNQIWGGKVTSTGTGEYAFTYCSPYS